MASFFLGKKHEHRPRANMRPHIRFRNIPKTVVEQQSKAAYRLGSPQKHCMDK